jgi:hypothetical protein
MGRPSAWTAAAALALVLAAGVALRAAGLDRPLWIDEAVTWAAAELPVAQILKLRHRERHPPLYYVLQHFLLLAVPDSEAGLRALSLLCSSLTLGVALWLLYRHWGAREALCAGVLLALSSFDIYYAQEARMYALLSCLWLAHLWSLNEMLEGSRRAGAVWVAACALLAYTHFHGLLVALLGIATALWFTVRRRAAGSGRALFPALPIAGAVALLLPSLAWLLQRLAADPGAAGGDRPDVADLLRFAGLSSAGLIGARSQFLSAEDLAPSGLRAVPELAWSAVGAALLAVPLIVGLRRAAHRDGRWRRLVALSAILGLGTVLVPFAAGLLFRGYAWALKTLLGPSVMVLLWAGIGLAGLRPPVRAALLGSYALLAACSLAPFYTEWDKTPLGAALQDLARNPETDRIVLIERAPRAPLAFFYLRSGAEILAPMPGPGAWTVARITPAGPWGWLAEPETVSCESLARHGDRPIHLVARRHRVRAEIDQWPECLRNRRLLEFRRNRWRPLRLAQPSPG